METLVLFHRLAYQEFQQIERWYFKRSARASKSFRFEMNAAIQRAIDFPEGHPTYSPDTRWVKLRRFPVMVVFQIRSATSLFIVAVPHGRRRAGYWKRRVR